MEGSVERLIDELNALRRPIGGADAAVGETRPQEKPSCTLAELMGVSPEAFPANDKIDPEQAARLTQAILDLWKSFGVKAVYPEGFPPYLLYPLLVTKFTDFRVAHDSGVPTKTIYVEFCDYNPAHCPFGRKYCQTCWDDGAEQEMLQA